jgi:antitoxin PrlF
MESALTSKGQMTVPKAIREHLHLKPGDRVRFFVHPDGTVVLLPKLPITALKGLLKTTKHATISEMNDAIAVGASERYRRHKRK